MGSVPQLTFLLDTTDNTRSQTLAHPVIPDPGKEEGATLTRASLTLEMVVFFRFSITVTSMWLLVICPKCILGTKQTAIYCSTVLRNISKPLSWASECSGHRIFLKLGLPRPAFYNRHGQIYLEKLFSEASLQHTAVQGEGLSEGTGTTITLCQLTVPLQPWCRIFHTNETWGTRTSNPIWAHQHSASDQSIPTHHSLWAAVIPYLLQRACLYSQGCFPRASDPETYEKAQIFTMFLCYTCSQQAMSSLWLHETRYIPKALSHSTGARGTSLST